MGKQAKRGRLLAGDSVGADVVWAPLESSAMTGFRRELIAHDSITVLLRKYRVGNHVHILHLQIFTRYNSQNNEVDLGKLLQIINSFAVPLLFLFHQRPKII